MSTKKIVSDLLNELSKECRDLSFKTICLYSDGLQETIYKITLYKRLPPYENGYIIYRLEDGLVVKCAYKSIETHNEQNIIDLLLDIINIEKSNSLSLYYKLSSN